MTYSEKLAGRVRASLGEKSNVQEKKMFGGLAFIVNGKMCVTVGDSRIMCRVDPGLHQELVRRQGCQALKMRGREYKGYVRVSQDALGTKKALDYWVGLALEFNKKAKASRKKNT